MKRKIAIAIGALVCATALLYAVAAVAMRSTWFHTRYGQSFRIVSGNMEPTILEGDFVFAKPLNRNAKRGEVIVRKTNDSTTIIRIVGLPGDTIAMLHGELFVNGNAVVEPYAQNDTSDFSIPQFAWQTGFLGAHMQPAAYRATLQNWGPIGIPEHQYFALGDNRVNSLDSRFFGFIAESEIVARASSVYSHRDRDHSSIRWERIGRALEVPASADTVDPADTIVYFAPPSHTQRQIAYYTGVMRALKEPSLARGLQSDNRTNEIVSLHRVVHLRSFEPAIAVRMVRRKRGCEVVTIIMRDSEIVWSTPDTTGWSVPIGNRPGKDIRRDSTRADDAACTMLARTIDAAMNEYRPEERAPRPIMHHQDQWILERADRTEHKALDVNVFEMRDGGLLGESTRLALRLGRVVPERDQKPR